MSERSENVASQRHSGLMPGASDNGATLQRPQTSCAIANGTGSAQRRSGAGILTSPELAGPPPAENVQRRGRQDRLSNILWRLAFGAIGWPWLLRSLWGGRKRDRLALLDDLGLPPDALPNLGSWRADVVFLRHIADEIARMRPRNIVEIGAGSSTLVAAQALARYGGGALHSLEQHEGFARATAARLADHGLAARIMTAGLTWRVAGWPGRWHASCALPEQIDMLIIDGPPWTEHPLVRGAAECLFARLSPGAVILLDDAARPGERIVARRWRRRWPSIDFRFDPRGSKGTLIGRKQSWAPESRVPVAAGPTLPRGIAQLPPEGEPQSTAT